MAQRSSGLKGRNLDAVLDIEPLVGVDPPDAQCWDSLHALAFSLTWNLPCFIHGNQIQQESGGGGAGAAGGIKGRPGAGGEDDAGATQGGGAKSGAGALVEMRKKA